MTFTKFITVLCIAVTCVSLTFSVGFVGSTYADMSQVRADLATRITTAQVHIDDQQFADAHRVLDEIAKQDGLNAVEAAQIHNMRGYAFFHSGDYAQAIVEYARVLDGEGLPNDLINTTLYTLAQLHFVQEEFADSIGYARRWMARTENPGVIPRVFIAQTQYQMERYDDALVSINDALAIAQDTGSKINPNWLKLRDHLVSIQQGGDDPAPVHTGVDGDYYPITKSAPLYPPAARLNDVEGYVVVEFVVGVDGKTHNHMVVDAQPAEIFDRAAINAARKFTYKPRIKNGQPVAVAGVRNKIQFTLGD